MVSIARQIRQNLFYLGNHIALIGKRYLVPNLRMNDISGPAEVCNDRHRAGRESFKYYACAVVADRWKHHHVSGSQTPEDFSMPEPATERNALLDPKGSRELLKAVSLRPVADDGETGQIPSQKRSSSAQS